MTNQDILSQMSAGCKAEEFERKIGQEILSRVPQKPTKREMEAAKLMLQELFHWYRRKNPCRASAFVASHRCVYQVYIDAYEQLEQLQTSTGPPSFPSRPQRKIKAAPTTTAAPPPTQEELLAKIVEEIENAQTNSP